MPSLVILWWRDIPAQVVAREGRRTARRELPPRFAEAVDRAAMAGGARDEDAYLAAWRRSDPQPCGDDLEAEAQRLADRLDAEYPEARLGALVLAGGREGRP
jgi:Virulence factor